MCLQIFIHAFRHFRWPGRGGAYDPDFSVDFSRSWGPGSTSAALGFYIFSAEIAMPLRLMLIPVFHPSIVSHPKWRMKLNACEILFHLRFMGKWINSNNYHEVTDQTFAGEIYTIPMYVSVCVCVCRWVATRSWWLVTRSWCLVTVWKFDVILVTRSRLKKANIG